MPSPLTAKRASRPPPYRQLGSGGQQPVRVQMLIGLVIGLVLVAVPLYLWRRPEQSSDTAAAAAGRDAGASLPDGASAYVPLVDASVASSVKLSPFKNIRCTDPGPGKTPPKRCDHITFFEDGLSRAIQDNVLCAPSTKTGATVSLVFEFDFRRKQVKLYRGKSSALPASRTKELFRCVRRALPTPEWGSIPHQHARYVVNVRATYPPSETF